MKLYLHRYINTFGFQNAFLWYGSDDDNAYFHFLTQARIRNLDVDIYEDAIDITKLIAPQFVRIKALLKLTRPSLQIYIALAAARNYILPAVIVASSVRNAQCAYLRFAKQSDETPTLLLLRDVTSLLREIISKDTHQKKIEFSIQQSLSQKSIRFMQETQYAPV